MQRQFITNARKRRDALLSRSSPAELQGRAVRAIASAASCWLRDRTELAGSEGYFPAQMVWISLEPLLESLNEDSCWELIERESVRGCEGPAIIGHIIAGNTPLLALTSVVRALLVGSGSIVKMPRDGSGEWLSGFLERLRCVDPEIAELVDVFVWSREQEFHNQWFFREVDLVVAYGSDESIEAITIESPAPVVGYGHKFSSAIIPAGVEEKRVYEGLATDILMYDQTGCLSPHIVFVEGNGVRAGHVADRLAVSLSACVLPVPKETPMRAARVEEFRLLAAMEPRSKLIASSGTRWTVVVREESTLHVSPTHGIIYVVPGTKEGIIQLLMHFGAQVQGVALAANDKEVWADWASHLFPAGISRVCDPGILQTPTIHWREDNRDVLRTLVT